MKYMTFVITFLSFLQLLSFFLTFYFSDYQPLNVKSIEEGLIKNEFLVSFINYFTPQFILIFSYQYYFLAVYSDLDKNKKDVKGIKVAIMTSILQIIYFFS